MSSESIFSCSENAPVIEVGVDAYYKVYRSRHPDTAQYRDEIVALKSLIATRVLQGLLMGHSESLSFQKDVSDSAGLDSTEPRPKVPTQDEAETKDEGPRLPGRGETLDRKGKVVYLDETFVKYIIHSDHLVFHLDTPEREEVEVPFMFGAATESNFNTKESITRIDDYIWYDGVLALGQFDQQPGFMLTLPEQMMMANIIVRLRTSSIRYDFRPDGLPFGLWKSQQWTSKPAARLGSVTFGYVPTLAEGGWNHVKVEPLSSNVVDFKPWAVAQPRVRVGGVSFTSDHGPHGSLTLIDTGTPSIYLWNTAAVDAFHKAIPGVMFEGLDHLLYEPNDLNRPKIGEWLIPRNVALSEEAHKEWPCVEIQLGEEEQYLKIEPKCLL
ncbi:hypothetical protein J132_07018 [Termitomyces sp. J132]|nr:hypothetical protein J132_07018 [Termitomyces sp. J132]